jgi:hypothetical protein
LGQAGTPRPRFREMSAKDPQFPIAQRLPRSLIGGSAAFAISQ